MEDVARPGYRRRCDVGGCGRPADLLTPAPWDLAWCSKHGRLYDSALAMHRWLYGPASKPVPFA